MLETNLLHGRATKEEWMKAALDRYDPLPQGEDRWMAIPAWTLRGGINWVIDRRAVPGDDPRVHPDAPKHCELSWISCVYHFCKIHALDKGKHQVYPIRGPSARVINDPYEKNEAEFYECVHAEPGTGCVMLRQSAKCPEACARDQKTWRRCQSVDCPRHMKEKVFDWHRTREQKETEELRRHEKAAKALLDIKTVKSKECALKYGQGCRGCIEHPNGLRLLFDPTEQADRDHIN